VRRSVAVNMCINCSFFTLISRISPGAPLRPIGTNFWLRVRLVDVINCAKFYRNRLRGSDSMSGQIWPLPNECDVAINTAGTNVPAVIFYFFSRARLLKWFAIGFWREMAQNTQNDALMCLLGVRMMADNIYRFKFPKTVKMGVNFHCRVSRLHVNEDWRHRRMTSLARCGVVN